MTVMMAKLYAALRAGDVPDEIAQAAAEEAAGYENQAGNLTVLQWMVGINMAMTSAILFKMFA